MMGSEVEMNETVLYEKNRRKAGIGENRAHYVKNACPKGIEVTWSIAKGRFLHRARSDLLNSERHT